MSADTRPAMDAPEQPAAPAGPTAILHAVHDPLCGWCYAAAPLLRAAASLEGLTLELHGGGMLAGNRRLRITPQWRAHVLPHDRRIAELSGQPFGAAYLDGLLRDTDAVMDSGPPTTALLAAEALGGDSLQLLERIQQAHYVEGRRVADRTVLRALAHDIGLPEAGFDHHFGTLAGEPTQRHIADSHRWLQRLGGQGFPTLGLERRGQVQTLDVSGWVGRAEVWGAWLRGLLTT
ncbi:MAG: hypothetical protein RLY78_2777 [Pseudomonadota bacterium]